MPFNGSGTYSVVYDFVTEAASAPIEIAKLDGQFTDMATALSNCILRDGTGLPTATIDWNTQRITNLGNSTTASGPTTIAQFQSDAAKTLGSVAGTDTITGNLTPALTAYTAGMKVAFTPANNNAGAATININSLGAKSIVKGDGTALAADDLQASTAHLLMYDGTNFVLLNPLSPSLVNLSLSGTLSVTGALTLNGALTTDNSTADEAGFKGLPQNTQGGDYTLVLSDAGKMIQHSSASPHAWTVPPDSSVAFPLGTVITLLNPAGGGAVTITQGVGVTIEFAGTASTTGNRTLTAIGLATILKSGTNVWAISGTGLS
jgi:hypothetical protein